MKPEKILLPLDVAKCPLDVFELVGGVARRPGITVILLHVIEVNIVAFDNHIYENLVREAVGHLERLVRDYLPPASTTLIRVRLGNPADEILAEARAAQAEPDHPARWPAFNLEAALRFHRRPGDAERYLFRAGYEYQDLLRLPADLGPGDS